MVGLGHPCLSEMALTEAGENKSETDGIFVDGLHGPLEKMAPALQRVSLEAIACALCIDGDSKCWTWPSNRLTCNGMNTLSKGSRYLIRERMWLYVRVRLRARGHSRRSSTTPCRRPCQEGVCLCVLRTFVNHPHRLGTVEN